jgi:hypothetical protein
MHIGSHKNGVSGHRWNGLIDEVRIYTRALTEAEIQAAYQSEYTLVMSNGGTSPSPLFTPSFAFSLTNSGNLSVTQGSVGFKTVTATLTSGMSQPVSFSLKGLPQGTAASFASTSCTPNCATTLTISTNGTTPAGTFPIIVSATGAAVTETSTFSLTVLPMATTQVASTGLVGQWKFDEARGATVSDSSPSGRNGTISGDPVFVPGISGNALDFNGNDAVSVPFILNPAASKFTALAWAYARAEDVTGGENIILVQDNGSGTGRVWLGRTLSRSGAKLFTYLGGRYLGTSTPLAFNYWYLVAVVFDGHEVKLYINGVKEAGTARVPEPSNGGLRIGSHKNGSSGARWNGLIDEVRIYNRALSDIEIRTTYQNESSIGAKPVPLYTNTFNFALSNLGDKSVTAGSSVTNEIHADIVAGSSQQVAFSAKGLPPGATASFSSVSCTPNCSSILTIATTGLTPAGNFPINVSAVGGGVTKTAAFILAVVLPLSTPTPDGVNSTGTVYYISPDGSDSNPGTRSQPWRTWSYALNKTRLKPGMTLIAKNGRYDTSVHGGMTPNCHNTLGNMNNGTASEPITVKAENERLAYIRITSEHSGIALSNCSFWIVEGFRVESENLKNQADPKNNILIAGSHHNILRRNLVNRTNAYFSVSPILLRFATHNLIEENEIYNFQRHGIIASDGSSNIFRRNYVNSRHRSDIFDPSCPGAYGRCPLSNVQKDWGDGGISIYPGNDNIVENNIVEDNYIGFQVIGTGGEGNRNKFLGNVCFTASVCAATGASTSGGTYPADTKWENNVVFNYQEWGFYMQGIGMPEIISSTAFGGTGFQARNEEGNAPNLMTLFIRNSLAVNGAYGFRGGGLSVNGLFQHLNSFNHTTADYAVANLQNAITIDPQLGSCKLWIPDNSPMKRRGANGADIGANVLYRYENGVLTTQPLWNPVTGEFPHGAIVPGINDIAGSSAFDVHQRLNINTNGCSFPIGYAR